MRHFVFLIAIFVSLIPDLRAEERFFWHNDVVALVGGEDMVVVAERGNLETLIQLALPDYKLKFRSLAREGDTVFEQRRDLNYPKLEDQLDRIGATVVICQFGQMESLAGEQKLPEFITAYQKLIDRLSRGGKRRIAVIEPRVVEAFGDGLPLKLDAEATASSAYMKALRETPARIRCDRFVRFRQGSGFGADVPATRDGFHANSIGFGVAEDTIAGVLCGTDEPKGGRRFFPYQENIHKPLTTLVAAKNRLWYYYYRPQNWAFLAGDRTNQPSSRDHLDPSKRWFPEELEKFVPLIDAKDAEIWALAKKLSAGGKN